MSMPTCTCARTTSLMPFAMATSSASQSYGWRNVRAFMPSMISGGRIRLPVWVVRMRSELRFMPGEGPLCDLSSRLSSNPDLQLSARTEPPPAFPEGRLGDWPPTRRPEMTARVSERNGEVDADFGRYVEQCAKLGKYARVEPRWYRTDAQRTCSEHQVLRCGKDRF